MDFFDKVLTCKIRGYLCTTWPSRVFHQAAHFRLCPDHNCKRGQLGCPPPDIGALPRDLWWWLGRALKKRKKILVTFHWFSRSLQNAFWHSHILNKNIVLFKTTKRRDVSKYLWKWTNNGRKDVRKWTEIDEKKTKKGRKINWKFQVSQYLQKACTLAAIYPPQKRMKNVKSWPLCWHCTDIPENTNNNPHDYALDCCFKTFAA